LLEGQLLAETVEKFTLPEESELSALSAPLEVFVSPDESSDEDEPPPPPPPPQEITRRIKTNVIRMDRTFFIFSLMI